MMIKSLPFIYLISGLLIFSCSSSTNQINTSNDSFTNTRWVLRVLNDRKVFIPESRKEIYIIFTNDKNKFHGNAGCNDFFGEFNENKNYIKMKAIARTRMYCEGQMDVEESFIKALETTSKFLINGNKLSLYDSAKIIAKLEAVYMN